MKVTIEQAVGALRANKKVLIVVDMGSCQCGSHRGEVWIDDGVVMARCEGQEAWQRYHGHAEDCRVAYGWGRTAQAISRAYHNLPPDANAHYATAAIYVD